MADGPTTPILDTFVRADENPLSQGGNWAIINTSDPRTWTVSNNLAAPTVGNNECGSYYLPTGVMSASEAYVTVQTYGNGSSICVRLQQVGGANTWDGYYADFITSAGLFELRKTTNAVNTILFSITAMFPAIVSGDSIMIRAVGPVIAAWINRASRGFWEKVCQVNDTTYPSGYIGMKLSSANVGVARFSNFGGGQFSGDLSVPSAAPVLGRGATW